MIESPGVLSVVIGNESEKEKQRSRIESPRVITVVIGSDHRNANEKAYDEILEKLLKAFDYNSKEGQVLDDVGHNSKQGRVLDFDGISGILKELKLTFQPLQIALLFQNHKSQCFQQEEFMNLFSPMGSYQGLFDVFSSCDPNKTGYIDAVGLQQALFKLGLIVSEVQAASLARINEPEHNPWSSIFSGGPRLSFKSFVLITSPGCIFMHIKRQEEEPIRVGSWEDMVLVLNGIFVALVGVLVGFLPKDILPRSSSKVYTPFLADPLKNITFRAYDTLTLLILIMWSAAFLASRRNRGRRLGRNLDVLSLSSALAVTCLLAGFINSSMVLVVIFGAIVVGIVLMMCRR